MKALYDIYNEECCATPSNTTGMGNPMPATDTQLGSEPLIPTAKTKTEKKQKRKKDAVKEGILDDMETSIANGDKLFEVIEWYKNQRTYARAGFSDNDIKSLMNSIKIENNDTLVIDCAGDTAILGDFFIKDKIPGGIHNIKIYNLRRWIGAFNIYSFVGDLSEYNFEAYEDNGRIYGSMSISVKISSGNHLTFGNIICDVFTVTSPKLESIAVGKKSIILEVELERCKKLTDFFYDSKHNLQSATLPSNYVLYQLKTAGIMPWGAKISIK